MHEYCSHCHQVNEKIKQQEQTITQLLAMVAVANRKLNELTTQQKQIEAIVRVQMKSPRIKVASKHPQ